MQSVIRGVQKAKNKNWALKDRTGSVHANQTGSRVRINGGVSGFSLIFPLSFSPYLLEREALTSLFSHQSSSLTALSSSLIGGGNRWGFGTAVTPPARTLKLFFFNFFAFSLLLSLLLPNTRSKSPYQSYKTLDRSLKNNNKESTSVILVEPVRF